LASDLSFARAKLELANGIVGRNRSGRNETYRDNPQQGIDTGARMAALNQLMKQVHIDPSRLIPRPSRSVNHTERETDCPLGWLYRKPRIAIGPEFPLRN
jgi:hypothetical protein